MLVSEREIEELEMEYREEFDKNPPTLPMMISKLSVWYVEMLVSAIENKKEITNNDIDEVIEKYNIQYDLISEEKENGNQD